MPEPRMPVLFIGHGSPMNAIEDNEFSQGWIDAAQLERLAQPLLKNGYGRYLSRVLQEKVF